MQKNPQAHLARLGLATLTLAAGPALAQSVTIYGLLDAAVEHVSKVGASGASLTRMPGLSGSAPSRLGFRGSEDLGHGLKANFTLEQGLGVDSGTLNQGGRAFGRQAFVGLSGDFGSVTLGRQYTMLFWSLLDSDVLGPNTFGSGSIDSYLPNARYDNAVAYRYSSQGFSVGALYSLGRDTVNAGPSPSGNNCAGENAADKNACRGWSAMLKYDSPTWGLALARDQMNGGAGAFAGLTSSSLSDSRTTLNGYFKSGGLKLGAGLIERRNEASASTPKSRLAFVGASYAAAPSLTLEGQLFRLKVQGSVNSATLLGAKATYALSKRTAVYATLGQIDNDGTLALSVSNGQAGANPAAGASQTGLAAGVRHAF